MKPETTGRPLFPPLVGLSFGIMAASTAAIFIRYAQVYAPSLVIAAYRLSLATILLAPVALYRQHEELRQLRGRALALALLSGFFLALHFATWITSLEYTTVASSVVLVSTSPLWVALLAPFTIREPLSRLALWGMALALVGGVIVGLSDSCVFESGRLACQLQGGSLLGDLLAVAGALMAAAYLLIGRRLRNNLSLISYIFVVYGMAAVVLLLLTVSARQPFSGYPLKVYLWFLLLALVPQLLGHSSFNWALRYLSAAFVSISLLGEPIGSTLLAYFFLGETPTALKIFGAILILAGIYIASRSETAAASKVASAQPEL